MTAWIIRFSFGVIAGFSLLSTGCATVVSKSQYPVLVDNQPGPTYFSVYDHQKQLIHEGVTPQKVTLPAKSGAFRPAKYSIVLAGQQSTSQRHELKAGFDPWIAGNVVLGGGLGAIVDGATGAMFKLPEQVVGNVETQYAVTDSQQGSMIAASAMNPVASPGSGIATSEKHTTRVIPASATLAAGSPSSLQR